VVELEDGLVGLGLGGEVADGAGKDAGFEGGVELGTETAEGKAKVGGGGGRER